MLIVGLTSRSEGGHERLGRTESDGLTDPQLIITTLDANRWVKQLII